MHLPRLARPHLSRLLKPTLFFLLSSLALNVFASDRGSHSLAAPNWDHRLALQSAGVSRSSLEADRLISLVGNTDGRALVAALNHLAKRTDWSQPAREATLYNFARGLRQLEPFAVDAAVLDFLLEYQVNVLVAHEESFTTGVPLFPIRTEAAGVINQWTRQVALEEATYVIQQNPEELLSTYIANPHRAVRAGIEASIQSASFESLMILINQGLPLLNEYPELTGLLGKAALQSGDLQSVKSVFAAGKGSSLVELSRQVGRHFSSSDAGDILLSTLEQAPPATAAIVIATLAPYSIQQDSVGEALLSKLDDPALGSTAALSLATWGSEQQIQKLRNVAEKAPSSVAAKRAQTALSLEPTVSNGELQ
jgi:hypothetical protein